MATDKITSTSIADDLISGKTALGAEPADTDEFLVSDAGTLKRIDYSLIKGEANKVLQVKQQQNGSLVSNTATSSTHFDICAGSMTFTPTSSSSNILCMLSAGMDTVSNGANCGWSLSLSLAQSGGLAVSNDVKTQYGYYSATAAFGGQTYGQNLSYIESYANSSTNAITITGQGHNYSEGNSQTVKFQRSSLIVMEWV